MLNNKKIAFALALIGASLWAQTFLGGIRGTVTDKTGAVIAEAKVTLTDEGTGISRSTISNSEGGYDFNAVNPATYTIVVEKPGFKKLDQKGILVGTQGFLVEDVHMEVGAVSDSVNVTADVDAVEDGFWPWSALDASRLTL